VLTDALEVCEDLHLLHMCQIIIERFISGGHEPDQFIRLVHVEVIIHHESSLLVGEDDVDEPAEVLLLVEQHLV